MILADYLLLGAVLTVLLASIALVVKRHRRSLVQDRETARLLSHMATTVSELHKELAYQASGSAEQIAQTGDQPGEAAALTPAAFEHPRQRAIKYVYTKQSFQLHDRGRSGVGGSIPGVTHFIPYHVARSREDGYLPLSAANWWERPDPVIEPDSYRAILGGSAFDDAVIHAAKVGVIDTDQADALIFWADSTTAIRRTVSRGHTATPDLPDISAIIPGLRQPA